MSHAQTSPVQSSLSVYFKSDHRRCDGLWAEVEAAADTGDQAKALGPWRQFDAAMRRHFEMEESIFFPAFEDATGMHGGGPPAVMRMEHERMRAVLGQMGALADGGDLEGLVDHGDTLLMLIQQHNVKEEGILYNMADQVLAGEWPGLLEKIAEHDRAARLG